MKKIYDPPPVLYVRGELREEDELAVAIVGSRKTTPYGKWMTEKMGQELARGITIVSGTVYTLKFDLCNTAIAKKNSPKK